MRAFPVMLPSSVRYWTVVDDEYRVVGAADGYLQHLRLGQDAAESTTKAYAEALALYLRWCERTSRDWRTAAGRLGGFITWLRHAPGDPDVPASGPGLRDVRGAGRINRILAVVRGFVRHQVAIGEAPAEVLAALYDISDDRHLPAEVRGEAAGMRYAARPRHRLSETARPVDRAADAEVLGSAAGVLVGAGPVRGAGDGPGRAAPGGGDRVAALQPSQSALLAALAPAEIRHRVVAVSRVATNVGFGAGGGLGGLVAAHGLGGLVALLLGNAATYLIYVVVLAAAVAKEPPAEPMPGGYRRVLRDVRFVWLAGINVAVITVGWGYFSWVVPQYAHADLGLSLAPLGLLLLANAFTVAIAQLPVSRALEGRRRTTAIAISGAIFTGSFLLITAASWTRAGPAYATLLIASIAIGIGECFHTTALMPLVADMAPAALRGRYMAAISLSWWIGLALAPTAGTRLLAASPAAALLPAAGLTLAASVAALALGRHLPMAISRTPRPSAVAEAGEGMTAPHAASTPGPPSTPGHPPGATRAPADRRITESRG